MENLTHAITSVSEFVELFINQTNKPVFLTGKAGTGKTTLLKKIVGSTHKNTIIVASTGIAALNAGGVTIHSFFQLPFSAFIPDFNQTNLVVGNTKFESKDTLKKHFQFNKSRIKLFQQLELLIIDEVSMLRADLLDAMDWSLRNVRKNNLPFGGIQVLFVGDLLQLPPIVKPEEWNYLRNYYQSIYFFNAKVLQEFPPLYIELDKIYRQDDQDFIEMLNNLRDNRVTENDQEKLKQYVNPTFDATKEKGYITLTTHNAKADQINQNALSALKGKSLLYEAEVKGDFPAHLFPLDQEIELKVGAQIIFIKNDISFEKNFYNGKMGVVHAISPEEITVNFPDEKRTIVVEKYEWNNIKYTLDPQTNEIKEEILGTFVHYPIKLAWSITVHKSQGLTFEKAVLDLSHVFAPGQAYVALSRLKSLSGLVLLSPLNLNGLSNDQALLNYTLKHSQLSDLPLQLAQETTTYIHQTLLKTFDFYTYYSQWKSFDATMMIQSPKTEKGKDKAWATHQFQQATNAFEAAKKFQIQLNKLFETKGQSWEKIQERVFAACDYFHDIFDAQVYSVLKRRFELARIKKTKQYSDELETLQDNLVLLIQQLKKCRNMLACVASGKNITKESVKSADITNYLIAKSHSIQQELRNTNDKSNGMMFEELVEDDFMDVVKINKSNKQKTPKEIKKPTHEVSLDLYNEGKSIEEIAQIRQFSLSTIEGHFAKLIQLELIDIHDLMKQERIQEIDSLLLEHPNKTLGQLKEIIGESVSYTELRWVQASKML